MWLRSLLLPSPLPRLLSDSLPGLLPDSLPGLLPVAAVRLAGRLDLDADVVRAEALKRCAVQRFAVVRMGNADEQFGALLE